MFWLVTKQDHVSYPECNVIEMVDHEIDMLQAFAYSFLLRGEADVPDQISWSNCAEHDPIKACELSRNLLFRNLHKLMPLNLRERVSRHGGQELRLTFGILNSAE